MPRQIVAAEFKTFVKGLITEVSPLNFPENASLDEVNFVLNRDGSRDRRLGLDLESGYEYTTAPTTVGETVNTSSYRWIDGKGLGENDIIVVQVGVNLFFFEATSSALSSTLLNTIDLSTDSEGNSQSVERASYTRIGRTLVVAHGGNEITTFKYEDSTLEQESFRLKIRDFFGVDDEDTDGTDMTEGLGLLRRPTTQTDNHIYNLRNQSWGQKYLSMETGVSSDPIYSWKQAYTEYPANSDIVTRALYADTENSANRTIERFWESNLYQTDYGTGEPPRGAFVIDFVKRSESRLEEIATLEEEKDLEYPVTTLPAEEEGASAKTVAAYSGRIFYSGFPGAILSENGKTPDTSSFVLFSQLIKSGSEFGKCYQEGDPTSTESSDLLATDGGYVQVEDAFEIHSLVTMSYGLLVIAANGVWLITGGSDYGFSADNFLVKRISDKGCLSADSVVLVDDTVLYWGEEGIFQVAPNTYGDLASTNITRQTIQTLYDDIEYEYKLGVKGAYDPYEAKVKWIYGNILDQEGEVTELVLDTGLGAYYKNTYPNHLNNSVCLPVLVPPYNTTEVQDAITADGETVTADGEDVYVTSEIRSTGTRGLRYLVIENDGTSNLQFSFASVYNNSFRDWYSLDGTGLDAAAYLLTGYISGGEILREKQVMKLVTYFRRSETGFVEDEDGSWNPVNTSSCLTSAHWDWTDNSVAGRWSQPFEAYRLKRHYFPTSVDESFDNGEPVVTSVNKLRGKGRVVSLKMETSENKDLQLLGWSMVIGANNAA